ncbi:MAG: NTP/NDP exchange transporter [Kofleriaceae bacterium]
MVRRLLYAIAHMASAPTGRPLAERLLAPFAKVKPGEAVVVLLMTCTVFLILCAYYVLKTTREGLILTGGTLGLRGDELKLYAGGAMALLFAVIVPAYGALANRVTRVRLINISYVWVFASLVVFFVLGTAGVSVGLAFFIWLGLVNMFLIAQFWSYANDIYSEEQGKRLFAIIAIGGSLGAIVGPKLTDLAGTYELMLIAAAILAVCVVLFNVIDRIQAPQSPLAIEKDAPIGGPGGFALVLRDRYLLLIAAMLLVTNIVNTTGEYILSNVAFEHAAAIVPGDASVATVAAARREVIESFYADFFFWVNLVGFLIQAFVVSRVLAWFGVRAALFVLPVIAFGTYGAIAVIGGLAITRVAKIAENSTNYSLMNTVRQALFLPTSRAAKYKAKAAIDTFFVRFGDTIAALLVALALHTFGLSAAELSIANLLLVGVWIAITVGIARRHAKLSRGAAA